MIWENSNKFKFYTLIVVTQYSQVHEAHDCWSFTFIFTQGPEFKKKNNESSWIWKEKQWGQRIRYEEIYVHLHWREFFYE